MAKINLADIKGGDIFSEESHYIFQGKKGTTNQFIHLESGNTINLDNKYVEDLLVTADQFNKTIEVGKEDKFWTASQIKKENPVEIREGDLKQKGIKTIWNDMRSSQVFTVCFNKQGKELSATALQKAKDEKTAQVIAAIETAQKAKKGIANAAKDALKDVLDHPIVAYVPGEERILRGYKTQFASVNGVYTVIDMDLPKGQNQRQVNVQEIRWLIVDDVHYVVK